MMDLKKRFGRLVAVHRRRVGWTQQELADRTDMSADMISRIETGGAGARFSTIERLASALGIDPAALFIVDPVPGRDMRPALVDLVARLAKLSDDELAHASDVLEVATRAAPQRTRVTKQS